MSALCDEKLRDAFIQLVRDDVTAQRKENGQAFFVDVEVYDICYPSSVKEAADDSSLSKFLLRYHPPPIMSPSVLKHYFDSKDSRASKLVTLLSIGGKYGYHLLYMALREDGKKKAVEELEKTARSLHKKPPDSLFGHESSLQHPEPVNTLDATVHSSSSTKRVTEPLGEDVSIMQKYQQNVSKSLDYMPQDLPHRPDCNCTGHGCFQRGLSIPDNSSLYKDPVISKQEMFSKESMGFDVPSSETTLGTSEPSSRESSNTALCVDTETSELSQAALGDNVIQSSAGAYQYQTLAHTTEPSIEPKNIPDTSNSHHFSQYQNN